MNTASQYTATLKGSVIEIRFPFNWDILTAVKSIPGRRFQSNGNGKYWTAPLSVEAIEILRQACFQLDPQLETFLSRSTTTIDDVGEVDVQMKKELFPFQRQGVAFIEHRDGRALIGSEMGLGKTIQALAYLHLHPEKRPAVVVCPAHIKLVWDREIRESMPGQQNTQILYGTTPGPVKGDIIIVNYDILPQWLDTFLALHPQVLIVDEAHYCKNNKAQRTKATKKLARKAPHVLCLTGTPIVNRPIEGFNIVQMVDRTVFPDFWKYVHTYCDARYTGFGWDFSGASNKEDLHEKLQRVMIRHKKSEVLKELPDKIHSYIPMEISNTMEYQWAEKDFITYLQETKGAQAAQKASQAKFLVMIETLKQLAIKGKMTPAIQWIRDFIESSDGNGKLVVFTVHKETVETLMKEFRDIAVRVDGSVTEKQREWSIDAFQNDRNVKLFIGNIQAAGTGITLTAASSVAFIELPWVAGELSQAEDRCHRIGQKDAVNVYYLLANDTIEGKIATLLDKKRLVLDAVLDGRDAKDSPLLTELIHSYREEK